MYTAPYCVKHGEFLSWNQPLNCVGPFDTYPQAKHRSLPIGSLGEVSVVGVGLVQLVEYGGLRTSAATVPDRTGEVEGSVGTGGVREDVLEGLSPLDTVVETLEIPEVLDEVEHGRVRVSRVVSVRGTLVVNQGVCRDPRRDQESRDTGFGS
jgi:hypothetical protein